MVKSGLWQRQRNWRDEHSAPCLVATLQRSALLQELRRNSGIQCARRQVVCPYSSVCHAHLQWPTAPCYGRYPCQGVAMQCKYCSSPLHPSTVASTVRCERCGAVHHSDGEVISPRMIPIEGANWRASPWMPSTTRPVERGNYEVMFNDLMPVLTLYWDGAHFTWRHRRVKCYSLMKWRGQWEISL